ncbi:MAG TPA: iron-sulfur cluster assembly scaffold protein [Anaeromyxobacter sp.]
MTSDALYHEALLRLARAGTGAGRLGAPDATAARDNPLCGDDVVLDVSVRDGRIAAVGHRVRGCVLCQASASVLGAVAPGRVPAEITRVRTALAAMLREGSDAPGAPWEELAVFLPVRAVPSRHECVLLPFDALADAVARAKE